MGLFVTGRGRNAKTPMDTFTVHVVTSPTITAPMSLTDNVICTNPRRTIAIRADC